MKRVRQKPPVFDVEGYQASLRNLNGSSLPHLDARTKAANDATRARAAGTKLYVMRNAKIVAESPQPPPRHLGRRPTAGAALCRDFPSTSPSPAPGTNFIFVTRLNVRFWISYWGSR
jgi:hypothetical protein